MVLMGHKESMEPLVKLDNQVPTELQGLQDCRGCLDLRALKDPEGHQVLSWILETSKETSMPQKATLRRSSTSRR